MKKSLTSDIGVPLVGSTVPHVVSNKEPISCSSLENVDYSSYPYNFGFLNPKP